MAVGGGESVLEGVKGGGTVCQKERFIEMLISYSVALCKNRNPEECTSTILIQRP